MLGKEGERESPLAGATEGDPQGRARCDVGSYGHRQQRCDRMAARRRVAGIAGISRAVGCQGCGDPSPKRDSRPLCLAGQTGALGKAHEGVGELGGGEIRMVQARQGSQLHHVHADHAAALQAALDEQ